MIPGQDKYPPRREEPVMSKSDWICATLYHILEVQKAVNKPKWFNKKTTPITEVRDYLMNEYKRLYE